MWDLGGHSRHSHDTQLAWERPSFGLNLPSVVLGQSTGESATRFPVAPFLSRSNDVLKAYNNATVQLKLPKVITAYQSLGIYSAPHNVRRMNSRREQSDKYLGLQFYV